MRTAPLLLAVLLTAAPAAADGPVLLDRVLRQQVLEAKWMQLAVRPSELPRDPEKYVQALDAQRKQALDKLRQNAYVDVRE